MVSTDKEYKKLLLKFCEECDGLMKAYKSNVGLAFKCKCGKIEYNNDGSLGNDVLGDSNIKDTHNTLFSNALKQKGIKKLIHITDYSNLPSILSKGLLSRNEIKRNRISYINHTSEGVQRKCERNMKKNYNVDICDYVRLFFVGNTPMLRDICFGKKKHNQTIILQINLEVLDERISYFTNISCNRREVEWYNSTNEVEKLEELDWKVLNNDFDLLIRKCKNENIKGENIKGEYIGKRGAEILILEKIPPRYISKKVFVFSFKAAGKVYNFLEKNNINDVKVKIDHKRKYFPAFPYSDIYWDKVNGNSLPSNYVFKREDFKL